MNPDRHANVMLAPVSLVFRLRFRSWHARPLPLDGRHLQLRDGDARENL